MTSSEEPKKYASQHSEGAISALVNFDPFFRLTMYHVSLPSQSDLRPQYTKLSIEIGDQLIPKNLLSIKSLSDYLSIVND